MTHTTDTLHLVPRDELEANQPPVLPDTSGWVQREPGDVIEAGTPYVFISTAQSMSVRTMRRDYRLDEHVPGVYWTPPPAPVPVWSVLSTDREKPTLARVTWREGCSPNVTRGEYWRDERYVLDVYGERVGSLDEDVATVTPLHALDPSTHVPVERALIDEVLRAGGLTTGALRALAALADGNQS